MSLFLQDAIWWYEFGVAGKVYRSSTRTADKATAQKIENEHRDSLTRIGQRVSVTLHDIKAAEAAKRAGLPWGGSNARVEKTKAEMRPLASPQIATGTIGANYNELLINYGSSWLRKWLTGTHDQTLNPAPGLRLKVTEQKKARSSDAKLERATLKRIGMKRDQPVPTLCVRLRMRYEKALQNWVKLESAANRPAQHGPKTWRARERLSVAGQAFDNHVKKCLTCSSKAGSRAHVSGKKLPSSEPGRTPPSELQGAG